MNKLLNFDKVTHLDYRDYLMKQNNNLKWFLWDLNKTSQKHTYYFISINAEIVGAYSILKQNHLFVSIYIGEVFRRKSIGSDVIRILKKLNSKTKLIFKVSKFNKNSLLFFDTLITTQLIVKNTKQNNFQFYS